MRNQVQDDAGFFGKKPRGQIRYGRKQPIADININCKSPPMLEDIFLLVLTAILPVLIVLKNDKQMVHLLEGRLHKHGRDTSTAKGVFGRHKKPESFFFIVIGCWALVASFVALGPNATGLTIAAIGGICVTLGILGRIRSFHRADRELA